MLSGVGKTGLGVLLCSTWITAQESSRAIDHDFNLVTAGGYKDNVYLSEFQREASPFWQYGLSYFAYGELSASTEFTFSIDWVDRRYLAAGEVSKEQDGTVWLSATRGLGDWKYGAELSYIYLDSVVDVSVDELTLGSIKVKSHIINAQPFAEYAFDENWRLRFGPLVARDMSDELDDHTEVGPSLLLVRKLPRRAELELRYDFHIRFYDSRDPVDVNFVSHPGEDLRFAQHETELRFLKRWGEGGHWRTRLRLGYLRNDDNAFGTYDYDKYRAGARVGWENSRWKFGVEAKVLYYKYDERPSQLPGSETFRRWDYLLTARAERTLWKSLKFFVESEHEWSEANDPFLEYQVNTVWSGIDWGF